VTRDDTARSALTVYAYDGSFDGLLCCVFESYAQNEIPADILPEGTPMPELLPIKAIETLPDRANRVRRSIPEKMGLHTLDFIRRAFLTCCPQKELRILQVMRLGYRYGSAVLNRLTDEPVHALFAAVNHLNCEVNHYMGFIRFSDAGGALTAQIEPKNIVLPLMARHFGERYPQEQFLIYDKTHGMVLLHEDCSLQIFNAEDFNQPCPGEEEMKFRSLWRLFYDTIEIKDRHNPRCRMSHMPKRYWRFMTEFALDAPQETGIALSTDY
jgi:probable DNA metabolism protein